MSIHPETALRSRARRAYEFSRATNALALGSIVAFPAMFASMGCCSTPAASVVCGLGLAGTLAAARFIGLSAQSALRPGLMAGLVAFSFPVGCHLFLCPSGMCMREMESLPFVAAGAAFAAGIVMRFAFRGGSRLVAGSTAFLLGSLGSLAAGLMGPILTAVGLAAGSLFPLKALGRPGSA